MDIFYSCQALLASWYLYHFSISFWFLSFLAVQLFCVQNLFIVKFKGATYISIFEKNVWNEKGSCNKIYISNIFTFIITNTFRSWTRFSIVTNCMSEWFMHSGLRVHEENIVYTLGHNFWGKVRLLCVYDVSSWVFLQALFLTQLENTKIHTGDITISLQQYRSQQCTHTYAKTSILSRIRLRFPPKLFQKQSPCVSRKVYFKHWSKNATWDNHKFTL